MRIVKNVLLAAVAISIIGNSVANAQSSCTPSPINECRPSSTSTSIFCGEDTLENLVRGNGVGDRVVGNYTQSSPLLTSMGVTYVSDYAGTPIKYTVWRIRNFTSESRVLELAGYGTSFKYTASIPAGFERFVLSPVIGTHTLREYLPTGGSISRGVKAAGTQVFGYSERVACYY